jgi:osmotically-inducible protein OsmY
MKNRAGWVVIWTVSAAMGAAACGTAYAGEARDDQPGAFSQKNDKNDLNLTAKIRKAIVQDKKLSVTAHNVKIISRDGAVVLRGEVKNEDEKAAVLAKAQEIAGAGNVTDQMTVAPSK